MLATRALRRVGAARAFSTTTSTTARAAAARAALAASTRHVGARWTAATVKTDFRECAAFQNIDAIEQTPSIRTTGATAAEEGRAL